jgi:TRAP-type C4-dicarboxylate transport system substrate-binding protein
MVRFHSETDAAMPALYTAVFLYAMNRKTYDSLPPDLRKVIDDNSGLALARELGQLWDGSAPAARKLATDRGNQINVIPATELAQWDRAARPLYADWIADMNRRGLDGNALLTDARALIAQYAKAQPAAAGPTRAAPR